MPGSPDGWIRFADRVPRGHEHENGYHVGMVGDVSPVVRHDCPLDATSFARMLEPGWTHFRPVDIPSGPEED